VHGLGVTEHVQGTDGVRALVNLAILTGNLGRPGAGVNPLRGQNNVQGAAVMGCEPDELTGGIAIDAGRAAVERIWRRPLPRTRGLKLLEMMQAAEAGRLKALLVIGYDILLTNPHAAHTRRALQQLDLLVVQDMFFTQTASLAHVFLPAASSFEKDGTFMNAERRLQRVRQVIPPVGASRTDAEIICALAEAMGCGAAFAFRSAEEIWDEVRAVWPASRGATYARLDASGLQWPCPSEDHPGTVRLFEDGFAKRLRLAPLEYGASPEVADETYPFLLITGRALEQFNAGTMTGRTPDHELRPADTLDLCAADAASLGVADGRRVRVRSRRGEVVLPARITDALAPGQVFATFHTVRAFTNLLTSDVLDPVGTPEYKLTAVRLHAL
jgi:formate dehydrogenase major subunit